MANLMKKRRVLGVRTTPRSSSGGKDWDSAGSGSQSLSPQELPGSPSRWLLLAVPVVLIVSPPAFSQDFGGQQVIKSGLYWLNSVFPGDLDGDGDADVLSATGMDDRIVWYENVGMGHGVGGGAFAAEELISTAADFPTCVYMADLDGDGDSDVLSGSYKDSKIAWYENLGDGSFGPQQVITTTAKTPESVFAKDLDGDGDTDVLSATSQDGRITWYENQGRGTFGPPQPITGKAAAAVAVRTADLDGDGDEDVLSASWADNKIAWYENLGNGSFGPQKVITLEANGAASVYTADLDGDGDVDVLSASGIDDKIAWYENLGGGLFSPQQVISTAADDARDVHTADLDGDGDPDVLSASTQDDKIAWYENLGGGAFGPQQVITWAADGAMSVYATDLTGNGTPDVLSASFGDGKIAWFFNRMRDCNGNGLKDSDDIAGGTSLDCNGNGIPDECDLATEPDSDWNGDGFIDECFGPLYCSATVNSDGLIAYMALSGTPVLADNSFKLIARDLPNQQWGYFLMSSTQAFIPNFGGSSGNLCLGTPLHRFVKPPTGRILNSGSNRQFRLKVDLTTLPGGVTFQPGETWYFQAWYRDGVTSNTSLPIAVMWR